MKFGKNNDNGFLPSNSIVSRILKKFLRMSYRVLKPAPTKILKLEYTRSY